MKRLQEDVPFNSSNDEEDKNNGSTTTRTADNKDSANTMIKVDNANDNDEQQLELTKRVKNRMMRKTKCDPAVLEVRRSIQECCKHDDFSRAMSLYQQAVDNQTRIEAQTYYNLLNLCDGLGDRGVHIGTPKQTQTAVMATESKPTSTATTNVQPTTQDHTNTENQLDYPNIANVTIETRRQYAFDIKKTMESFHVALNEPAYTALIRILIKSKQVSQALALLEQAEQVQQCKPKLRLYSNLLIAFCDMDKDMDGAIQVWEKLSCQQLELTEKEQAALLRCATAVEDATVFQRVLSDLAEDVLVPSRETTQAIVAWFDSKHSVASTTPPEAPPVLIGGAVLRCLPECAGHASNMGPVQCFHPSTNWTMSHGCQVHPSTGVLQTGCLSQSKLQPVTLSPTAWKDMMDMNETIVLQDETKNQSKQKKNNHNNHGNGDEPSKYLGGGKGKKQKLNTHVYEKRKGQWNAFLQFLKGQQQQQQSSSSSCSNVVIDGANIGYYKQNFTAAPKHVDYRQIDWAVQHFVNKHQNVLLVLHERHFAPQLLPSWARPIVQKWEAQNILYKTPRGCNDDWFWLHAALFFGRKSLVVTNDEMRDHHFQMLAPRDFLRWKERHQVHFSFGGWESSTQQDAKHNDGRMIQLEYPDVYSRRIQRVKDALVIPLPRRGDENRFLDGLHVADESEPVEETYLYIRPRP